LIYVYALCPPLPETLPLPAGIAHASVQLVTAGELSAIAEFDLDVSHLKDDDQQLMQAVLVHDHVLTQMFAATVLLPLRFGTQLTDEAALVAYLQEHQVTYQSRLAALANKAEYLVKLTPNPIELPPLDESLKGRDYFLAKKQRLQAQTQAQTQQNDELQRLSDHLQDRDMPFVQSAPQAEEERLHVLAHRDRAIAQAQIAEWQALIPSWQITCSEPLPPYHFAS